MEKRIDFLSLLKGTLIAIIISILAILAISLIASYTDINMDVVPKITTAFKLIALFFGTLVGIKEPKRGFLKGLIIGFMFSVITYLVFSIIDGAFVFDLQVALSILLTTLFGGISGVIAVNIRK